MQMESIPKEVKERKVRKASLKGQKSPNRNSLLLYSLPTLFYNVHLFLVGIVYGWDYDGIWSSSIPQLSFLIKEDILGECFRIS